MLFLVALEMFFKYQAELAVSVLVPLVSYIKEISISMHRIRGHYNPLTILSIFAFS